MLADQNQERIMKEERGGGRSMTRLRTKLKIQNFLMLGLLLKIKLDVVAASRYLTAARRTAT